MLKIEDSEELQIAIEANNLSVQYNSHSALQLPDLTAQGNTIAIIGHNGAGKSTLLKSMLGITSMQGQLQVKHLKGNESLTLFPENDMAFCPEYGSVFPDIRVEEYIKLWCRIKRLDAKYYLKQGLKYIELLDVAPLLKRMGRALSKGERRRIQTAVGFLTGPKVFLFDEPFCGLDIERTFQLETILKQESENCAVILASHRMEVVERLADYVIVLRQGKLLTAGSTQAVAARLSGKEYTISKASNPKALAENLRENFLDSLVIESGAEVKLISPNIKVADLTELIRAQDKNGAFFVDKNPSLTEALQYHLKFEKK